MNAKKILRKVHLWLSVPFGIILVAVGFSGAMLSFETEISEALRPELYFVESADGQPIPVERLVRMVASELSDSVEITEVTTFPDSRRAYKMSLSKPRRSAVYVDQYSGELKGRSERMPFFDCMFRLHRWLLGSAENPGGIAWGKLFVGLATLAMVVIVLTGLLMWLTNRRKPLAQSLRISVTKGWPRFWHDLHVAGGIYSTVFLLAIGLTGLTWSFGWYRTAFYSLCGAAPTAQEQHEGQRGGHGGEAAAARGHHGAGQRGIRDAAAVGNLDCHHGHGDAGAEGRHHHDGGAHHGGNPWRTAEDVRLLVAADYPGYRQLSVAPGKISVVPKDRRSLRAADVVAYDVATGEVTGVTLYADQDRATRVRGAVYMVHTGSWGGIVMRIVNCLSALMAAVLALTGYYLWIARSLRRRNPAARH